MTKVTAAALLLAGCSSRSSMNPVNWWHSLEGGKIAEQRPPPPGSDDAYPNLGTIPARPTPPDRDALRAISAGLIADRAHAQHMADAAPLPDPSSPSASPALFGTGTMAPPPPAPSIPAPGAAPAASASLSAASAPPPAPTPKGPPPAPAPAPRAAVQSAPLAQPAPVMPPAGAPAAPAATAARVAPSAAPSAAPAPPPVAAAVPPALPATPPPRPNLPGVASNPVPSAEVAPEPSLPAGAVTVAFPSGSAALPSDAAATLRQIAGKRGTATIAVTGHGEAASSDPNVQAAALSLGLSRAQAVANALTAQGVPASAVRVGAQSGGRGASLRLIQ